ncbi:hypothetical protein ACU4GD_28195 [Cupriavidus basilensis]
MQRTQQMANLQINLDNQFVPPPFGTGVTMSVVQVVTDAEGRVVGQPAHQVQAVVPTDLTPRAARRAEREAGACGPQAGAPGWLTCASCTTTPPTAAAIVASSTAGGLVVANVQNDLLGLAHRSVGTAVESHADLGRTSRRWPAWPFRRAT